MESLHPDVYDYVLRLVKEEKKKKPKHLPKPVDSKKEVEVIRRIIKKKEVKLSDEDVVRKIVLDDKLLKTVLSKPHFKPLRQPRKRIRLRTLIFLAFLVIICIAWGMILAAMLFL